MPDLNRLFLTMKAYRTTAGLPVIVDWNRVISVEMVEDSGVRSDTGPKLYTVITLDTGHTYDVKETPTELFNSVTAALNPNMPSTP